MPSFDEFMASSAGRMYLHPGGREFARGVWLRNNPTLDSGSFALPTIGGSAPGPAPNSDFEDQDEGSTMAAYSRRGIKIPATWQELSHWTAGGIHTQGQIAALADLPPDRPDRWGSATPAQVGKAVGRLNALFNVSAYYDFAGREISQVVQANQEARQAWENDPNHVGEKPSYIAPDRIPIPSLAQWEQSPAQLRQRRTSGILVNPTNFKVDAYGSPQLDQPTTAGLALGATSNMVLRQGSAHAFPLEQAIGSSWLGQVGKRIISTFEAPKFAKRLQMLKAHGQVEVPGLPTIQTSLKTGPLAGAADRASLTRVGYVLNPGLGKNLSADIGTSGQSYLEQTLGQPSYVKSTPHIEEPSRPFTNWVKPGTPGAKAQAGTSYQWAPGIAKNRDDYWDRELLDVRKTRERVYNARENKDEERNVSWVTERMTAAAGSDIDATAKAEASKTVAVRSNLRENLVDTHGKSMGIQFLSAMKDVQGTASEFAQAEVYKRAKATGDIGGVLRGMFGKATGSYAELGMAPLQWLAKNAPDTVQTATLRNQFIHEDVLPRYQPFIKGDTRPVAGNPKLVQADLEMQLLVGDAAKTFSVSYPPKKSFLSRSELDEMLKHGPGSDSAQMARGMIQASRGTRRTYQELVESHLASTGRYSGPNPTLSQPGGANVAGFKGRVVEAVSTAMVQAQDAARVKATGAGVPEDSPLLLQEISSAFFKSAGDITYKDSQDKNRHLGREFMRFNQDGEEAYMMPLHDIGRLMPGEGKTRFEQASFGLLRYMTGAGDPKEGAKAVFGRYREAQAEIAESESTREKMTGATVESDMIRGAVLHTSPALGINEAYVPGLEEGTVIHPLRFPTEAKGSHADDLGLVNKGRDWANLTGWDPNVTAVSQDWTESSSGDADADQIKLLVKQGKLTMNGSGQWQDVKTGKVLDNSQAILDYARSARLRGAGDPRGEMVGADGNPVPRGEAGRQSAISKLVGAALHPNIIGKDEAMASIEGDTNLRHGIGYYYNAWDRMKATAPAGAEDAVQELKNISHGHAQRPERQPAWVEKMVGLASMTTRGSVRDVVNASGKLLGFGGTRPSVVMQQNVAATVEGVREQSKSTGLFAQAAAEKDPAKASKLRLEAAKHPGISAATGAALLTPEGKSITPAIERILQRAGSGGYTISEAQNKMEELQTPEEFMLGTAPGRAAAASVVASTDREHPEAVDQAEEYKRKGYSPALVVAGRATRETANQYIARRSKHAPLERALDAFAAVNQPLVRNRRLTDDEIVTKREELAGEQPAEVVTSGGPSIATPPSTTAGAGMSMGGGGKPPTIATGGPSIATPPPGGGGTPPSGSGRVNVIPGNRSGGGFGGFGGFGGGIQSADVVTIEDAAKKLKSGWGTKIVDAMGATEEYTKGIKGFVRQFSSWQTKVLSLTRGIEKEQGELENITDPGRRRSKENFIARAQGAVQELTGLENYRDAGQLVQDKFAGMETDQWGAKVLEGAKEAPKKKGFLGNMRAGGLGDIGWTLFNVERAWNYTGGAVSKFAAEYAKQQAGVQEAAYSTGEVPAGYTGAPAEIMKTSASVENMRWNLGQAAAGAFNRPVQIASSFIANMPRNVLGAAETAFTVGGAAIAAQAVAGGILKKPGWGPVGALENLMGKRIGGAVATSEAVDSLGATIGTTAGTTIGSLMPAIAGVALPLALTAYGIPRQKEVGELAKGFARADRGEGGFERSLAEGTWATSKIPVIGAAPSQFGQFLLNTFSPNYRSYVEEQKRKTEQPDMVTKTQDLVTQMVKDNPTIGQADATNVLGSIMNFTGKLPEPAAALKYAQWGQSLGGEAGIGSFVSQMGQSLGVMPGSDAAGQMVSRFANAQLTQPQMSALGTVASQVGPALQARGMDWQASLNKIQGYTDTGTAQGYNTAQITGRATMQENLVSFGGVQGTAGSAAYNAIAGKYLSQWPTGEEVSGLKSMLPDQLMGHITTERFRELTAGDEEQPLRPGYGQPSPKRSKLGGLIDQMRAGQVSQQSYNFQLGMLTGNTGMEGAFGLIPDTAQAQQFWSKQNLTTEAAQNTFQTYTQMGSQMMLSGQQMSGDFVNAISPRSATNPTGYSGSANLSQQQWVAQNYNQPIGWAFREKAAGNSQAISSGGGGWQAGTMEYTNNYGYQDMGTAAGFGQQWASGSARNALAIGASGGKWTPGTETSLGVMAGGSYSGGAPYGAEGAIRQHEDLVNLTKEMRVLNGAMLQENRGYQQAGFNFAQTQLDLAKQGAQLQYQQSMESLDLSQEQFNVGKKYQTQNLDIQQSHTQAQYQWQKEDVSYQRGQAGLQYDWSQEDLTRNIRLSSGRQKMDLMRQRDRSQILFSSQEGQRTREESRLDTQAGWQKDSLALQRKQINEVNALQQKSFDMQRRHLTENYNLQMAGFAAQQAQLSAQQAHANNVNALEDAMRKKEQDWEDQQQKNQAKDLENSLTLAKLSAADFEANMARQDALMKAQKAFQDMQMAAIQEGGELRTAVADFIKWIEEQMNKSGSGPGGGRTPPGPQPPGGFKDPLKPNGPPEPGKENQGNYGWDPVRKEWIPKVPTTAAGGIVSSSQVRRVGEEGSEAIIPLTQLPHIMASLTSQTATKNGGTNIQIFLGDQDITDLVTTRVVASGKFESGLLNKQRNRSNRTL